MLKDCAYCCKQAKTFTSIGNEIEFTGTVHGSVGINYVLKFDSNAFSINKRYKYVDPFHAEMQGGDEQIVNCVLTAHKAFFFQIREVLDFRGEESLISKSYVWVKKRKRTVL